jgi:hypothetical protein
LAEFVDLPVLGPALISTRRYDRDAHACKDENSRQSDRQQCSAYIPIH